MYAAMIALEMTYTPCVRNSKGLGGKLTETELRGPNCEPHKESSRPPRDRSATVSDRSRTKTHLAVLDSRTAPDATHTPDSLTPSTTPHLVVLLQFLQ